MNFTWREHVPSACPCAGQYEPGTGRHFVWLAFLHHENEEPEFRPPGGGRLSSWGAFANWATTVFDASSIMHVQMLFWSDADRAFHTFSVDSLRDAVFPSTRKQFRRGWTFMQLAVSAAEECAMHEFYRAQVAARARFNRLGAYLVHARPIDVNAGRAEHGAAPPAFFCSELVVCAMHAAGLLLYARAHAVSPASLESLVRRYSPERIAAEPAKPVRH